MQVESIRFRKQYGLYSRLLFRSEGFNAISPTELLYPMALWTCVYDTGQLDAVSVEGQRGGASQCCNNIKT